MILPIPFFEAKLSLTPSFLWQFSSTLLAFLVVILTTHQKSYAWVLNIVKKLMNLCIYYYRGLYLKVILDLILIVKSGLSI